MPVALDSNRVMALGRYLPCACMEMPEQFDLFKANIGFRHRVHAYLKTEWGLGAARQGQPHFRIGGIVDDHDR
jgi:hypothetical protein